MANTSKYAYNRRYYENLARNNAYNGNAARKLAVVEEDYDEYDELEEFDEFEEQYVEDEAAYEAEPERDRRAERRERRERRAERYARQDAQKENAVRYKININMFSVTVFAVAIVSLVFCAFRLLEVQSDISQTDKLLKTAQIKLDDVEALNASLMSALDTEIDRNYIYSVAVGKLGMVYPDNNQVVYYEPAQEGYVRQLAEIPNK